MLELASPVVARALDAFPVAVHTLDALHLSSIEFLRSRALAVELASYDRRMVRRAQAMGIPVRDLP
ncbi:hypothetical protein [Candidatus Palauibacter sp.]|uniref:hypothetical protein n=1 Tax=Candidatus Palauibacter sp. TaxID=3101350 RepID=UPI003B5BC0CA